MTLRNGIAVAPFTCRVPARRDSVEALCAFRVFSMGTLEDKPFDQAVKVHGERAGKVEHIGSARKAAEWLLYKWPFEIDTAKARAARKACLEALEGQRKAAAARKAFREAAEEAGILIGDDDRPLPGIMKRTR
jgi:hypothetical protein